MTDKQKYTTNVTHYKSTTIANKSPRIIRRFYWSLVLLLLGLLFSLYYNFTYLQKIHSKNALLDQQDSIINNQNKKIKSIEKTVKNLELYNRDLLAQKTYYSNIQPFKQTPILPIILDIKKENENISAENIKKKPIFISPLDGYISNTYNADEKHLALDLVSRTGDPVKAIADGYVIFTDWTPETGFVIVVDHTNDFLSIYKHNLDVYKKIGDKVTQGETISSVGNTGEFTTGPHLHLEIWHNGKAVNPELYINFKKSTNT
ncbi:MULTISPECIES: M23 family metallopeptidase [Weeksella]|uniref:M23 family metallopeptidase n=1 Tax=Weeksella TaxID=1013 RepID=UPI0008A26EA0|nr:MULTISPECIES: M23 family metallopeptidase [Weeksella]MDK7375504.1 M23 family metallopeptidase [Weeksella virosa]MDK7674593.1 M23 family metallopeptidase [Weeksella virosa]OFM84291.1 hypothetical protein HMPREF2660_08840 [Weeksella sp. HMSC059D05]